MSEGDYKSGKLNVKEVEEIGAAVREYLTENSIDYETFCELVHDNERSKKHAFWSHFTGVLPQRKGKNVREYMRKAHCPTHWKRPFSEEDLVELAKLVGKHGKSWSKIGGLLQRYREHCQHAYKRLEDRQAQSCHGFWTPEEESKLQNALEACAETQRTDWQEIANRVGTRTAIQCSDHHRASYRNDSTYSKGRKRLQTRRGDTPRARKQQKTGDDAAVLKLPVEDEPKRLQSTGVTNEQLLRFLQHLRTLSNDEGVEHLRSSDLSGWGCPQQDGDAEALLRSFTSKYKKIRQWRSLSSGELLQRVEDDLSGVI